MRPCPARPVSSGSGGGLEARSHGAGNAQAPGRLRALPGTAGDESQGPARHLSAAFSCQGGARLLDRRAPRSTERAAHHTGSEITHTSRSAWGSPGHSARGPRGRDGGGGEKTHVRDPDCRSNPGSRSRDEGRDGARAGHHHAPAPGGRRPLRPPDQALEPEDEAVHLRRPQRHLHHRPAEDGAAGPRGAQVRQRRLRHGRRGAVRGHQEAGPGRGASKRPTAPASTT